MKRSPALALLALLASSSPAAAQEARERAQEARSSVQEALDSAQEGREGAPRVHVQTSEPATTLYEVTHQILIRGRPAGLTARPVCQGPCDRIVEAPGGRRFFFAGEGLTPSSQFQLAGKGPTVSIDIVPGSAGQRTGGYVMGAFGGAALLGGLTTLALGALTTSVSNGQALASPSIRIMAAGGGIAAAGLGLLIGGIAMVVKSKTTYAFPSPGTSTALLTF
jgi:hypothetical protein